LRLLPTVVNVDELRLFFAVRERAIDLYGSVKLEPYKNETTLKNTVSVGYPVITATFDGRLLYVSNAKGLYTYKVFTDFSVVLSSRLEFSSEITCLLPWKGRLLAFTGNKVLVYDMSDPVFPKLVEERAVPMPVTDVTVDGSFLYTVGPFGMAVYDSRPALPRLIDFGGRQEGTSRPATAKWLFPTARRCICLNCTMSRPMLRISPAICRRLCARPELPQPVQSVDRHWL